MPAPASISSERLHELDALRAFAMLLGIVLHALLSFVPISIWPAQDVHQYPRVFGFLQHAIHGFRMPLFFLLSGFFTAMLWQRRGLRGLLKQRLLRIGLPLLIGTLITWPTMAALGVWGGAKKQEMRASAGGEPLSQLVRSGETEALLPWLEENDTQLNQPDRNGITPLAWAALEGRPAMAALLIEAGAEVNARNADGSTPLHAAVFLGRSEVVRLLLENGASTEARNHQGSRPIDGARADWGIVAWVADELDLSLDRNEVETGREAAVAVLEAGGSSGLGGSDSIEGSPADPIIGMLALGAFVPVFHHLWFLYYLLWLLAGFGIVAWLSRRIGWIRFPAGIVGSRWRAIWFVLLVLVPQLFMTHTFGADTATGIIPWPPLLGYYGVFFAIGALFYTKGGLRHQLGRRWWIWGLLALPVLGIGLMAFENRMTATGEWMSWHLVASLFAVLYAWLMIAAMVGGFGRWFPAENRTVRYLSDAAYFLYLAHLPLIIAAQIWVSDWELSGLLKFSLVTLVPTLFLLVVYETVVRYTFIGAMLNGRKFRSTKAF